LIEISHKLGGPDQSLVLVRVPRELNHESAEPLRSAVMRALPNRDGAGVILDMEEVAMVSSIGVAALLQVQEFCRDRQAGLVLACVPQRQMAFLKMLKLDRKFAIESTMDAAVARLSNGSA
jgi:anti-anti-sigma factor